MKSNSNKDKITFFAIVFCVCFATLYLSRIYTDMFLSYFLTFVLFLIMGVTIFHIIRKRKFDIFELACWSLAYFLLIFGIRAVSIFIYGSYLGYPPFDSRTLFAFNLSLFYVIVSLIIFLIGYYCKFGVALANIFPLLPKTWDKSKAKVLIIVLFILGLFFRFLLIQRLGGLNYFLFHKQEILAFGITGNHYLAWGASLHSYSFFVAYLFWLKNRSFSFLTWGILFPVTLVFAFLSGSKGSFLGTFLVMLIMYNYLKKRIHLKHIVLYVLLAFLAFPIFNIYRGDFKNISELLPRGERMIGEMLGDMETTIRAILHRFEGIDSLTIIVRDTPDTMDFQFGKTMATILVAPIPRGLWKDKPIISFGKIFAMRYLHSYSESAAPTIIGEGYINFHIAGIIFFSFMIGVLSRFVYYYCIHKNFGDSSVYVYAFLLVNLFKMWEWNIPGWVTAFLPLVFTVAVISYLLKKT